MAKRDVGGITATIAIILPDKAWHWGWELVRGQLGEAAVKWLEHAASDDWMPWLWRLALGAVAIWLFWPRIKDRVPFLGPRSMTLREAAQLLYERSLHTAQGKMSRKHGTTESDILNWFADIIMMYEPLPVSGCRLASTISEPLLGGERGWARPYDGAKELRVHGSNEPYFHTVTIKRADFRKHFKKLLEAWQ